LQVRGNEYNVDEEGSTKVTGSEYDSKLATTSMLASLV
jgi:hypothetical protein